MKTILSNQQLDEFTIWQIQNYEIMIQHIRCV